MGKIKKQHTSFVPYQTTNPDQILTKLINDLREITRDNSDSVLAVKVNICLLRATMAQARSAMQRIADEKINSALEAHQALRQAFTGSNHD